MAVVERAGNLTTEFPGLLLLEPAMGDDVVKHLPTVDIFEKHVPMIISSLHVAHATDERMVK